jgi:hypothetical protein
MEKVGMGMAEVAMEKVMAASTVVVTAGSLAAAKTERVRAATTVKAVRVGAATMMVEPSSPRFEIPGAIASHSLTMDQGHRAWHVVAPVGLSAA